MLSDAEPSAATPILVGPPRYEMQFCPNPNCRQAFNIDRLETIGQHFNSDSECGAWIRSFRSTNHEERCPNPICREPFDTLDDRDGHLLGPDSPCSTWYHQVLAGVFPAYPSIYDDDNGEGSHKPIYLSIDLFVNLKHRLD